MDVIERWTLYPVRSAQIKAAESDDHDHAEWVIRADGPLPGSPIGVVPASQLARAVSALEKYGQHHVGCSGAIHRDGDVLGCACGFANTLAAVRGR